MTSALADALAEARSAYYRLLLVVYPTSETPRQSLSDFAEANGWAILNVGLELSRRLVDESPSRQPHVAPQVLRELAESEPGDVIVLMNIPILFSPILRLQPLELFKSISRQKTLVVSWPGALEGRSITYAEPGWPEYRVFDAAGVSVLPIESPTDL